MKNYIIVFSEEDKEKLTKQGFFYVGRQRNSYIFRNCTNVKLEEDIVNITTDKVYL